MKGSPLALMRLKLSLSANWTLIRKNWGKKRKIILLRSLCFVYGSAWCFSNSRARPVKSWDEIPFSVYEKELLDEGLRVQFCDWKIDGLEEYFARQTLFDALPNALKIADSLAELSASYKKRDSYSDRSRRHHEFNSFAKYQLSTTRWLPLTKSPINLDGKASPEEIFVSDALVPVFPTISKSEIGKILSRKDADRLISSLNLKTSFEPSATVWVRWLRGLPNGYSELITQGQDISKTNFQIDQFCKIWLNSSNTLDHPTLKYPAIVNSVDQTKYTFLKKSTVWNDTPIANTQLLPVLDSLGFHFFAIGTGEIFPLPV